MAKYKSVEYFGVKQGRHDKNNRAFFDALNSGYNLIIPPNRYYVTEPLIIANDQHNLHITGNGSASEIYSEHLGFGFAIISGVKKTHFDNFTIRSFAYNPPAAIAKYNYAEEYHRAIATNCEWDGKSATSAIFSINNYKADTKIEDIIFRDFAVGVSAQNHSGLIIEHCKFLNIWGNSAFHGGYGISSSARNARIANNFFRNKYESQNGRHAIYINGNFSDVMIHNNIVENWFNTPMIVRCSTNNNVKGLSIKNNIFKNCNHHEITEVDFGITHGAGILIRNAGGFDGWIDDVLVAGNQLENCGGSLFRMENCRRFRLLYNKTQGYFNKDAHKFDLIHIINSKNGIVKGNSFPTIADNIYRKRYNIIASEGVEVV